MRKATNSPATPRSLAAQPTTIVFFDHTAALGGGEIALLNLLRALNHQKWTPVVVLGEQGPLADRLRQLSIETHILPLDASVAHTRKDSLSGARSVQVHQALSALGYVLRLAAYLRERGAGTLHTNSLKADVLGALAGHLAGVPILWHVRDRITDEYLPARAARLFRAACRVLPHAIAVNSRSTLDSLQMPESELVRVVHDGFAEPKAQGLESSDAAAGGGAPLFGLVGRISPWKGQDVFIRAAALVRERFPGARFQIIGSALFGEEEYEARIRALSRELQMEDALEFLGFRLDVERCIARLDVLVHASTMGEPFGQVVMEGMAARKPTIATRGGGVPEIMAEGETGLLVPMKDPQAMAEAMVWLLEHPEQARAMGLAGHARVEKQFTIAQTAAKIEAMFEALEAGRVRRARVAAAVRIGLAVAFGIATVRRR